METFTSLARDILGHQALKNDKVHILKKAVKSKYKQKSKEEKAKSLRKQKRLSADQKKALFNLPHKSISEYDLEAENLLKKKATIGGIICISNY